jgi:transcription antitermination protein NusB
MSFSPHKFREILFQMIYSEDVSQASETDMVPFLMEQHRVTRKILREVLEIKNQVKEKIAFIDTCIEKVSTEYALNRIPRAERNILRLGIYEILFKSQQIPSKVAIAEGIRLAKKYASLESSHFVNAILHAVYQNPEAFLGSSGISGSADTSQVSAS